MNAQTSKEIGAAVRSRRRELQVTQKDLALTCGMGLRFIIDLEKGKETCQIGKVLQVLQALGLKLQITSSSADAGKGR
jgi:HTH-type transcriptional regulator / antitoxin HipB